MKQKFYVCTYIHVDVLLLVRVLLQSEISWDDFMDRRRSLKMNVYSFLIDLITVDGSSSLSLSLFKFDLLENNLKENVM